MMMILGFASALVELLVRVVIWLYMPALICILIGFRFMKECCVTLLRRRDMPAPDRYHQARHLAFQGVQGLVVGVVIFFVIYFRKELYQCVTGLF
jgi:multisubunit Na+/H+ antiporter MnhG subunit